MLYVAAAFSAIILFGLGSILIKYIIPAVNGPIQFLALQLPLSTLLIFPLFLVFEDWSQGYYWSHLISFFPQILLASILAFVGFVFMNIGLERGNASVGSVVLSSRVFFSVPLAILVVGETYPKLTYLFILIALVGSILVSWRKDLSVQQVFLFQAKGVRWFFGTAFFWAWANMVVRQLNNQVSVISFIFIRSILLTGGSFFLYYMFRKYNHIKPIEVRRSTSRILGLYIISNIMAQILFIYALGQSLTITEAIGTGEGVVTLIGSVVIAQFYDNKVLDEPLEGSAIMVRIMGALLAIIGTLGVVVVS